jgi:hypothetical protein
MWRVIFENFITRIQPVDTGDEYDTDLENVYPTYAEALFAAIQHLDLTIALCHGTRQEFQREADGYRVFKRKRGAA